MTRSSTRGDVRGQTLLADAAHATASVRVTPMQLASVRVKTVRVTLTPRSTAS